MERTSVKLFDCSIRPDRLMGSSPLLARAENCIRSSWSLAQIVKDLWPLSRVVSCVRCGYCNKGISVSQQTGWDAVPNISEQPGPRSKWKFFHQKSAKGRANKRPSQGQCLPHCRSLFFSRDANFLPLIPAIIQRHTRGRHPCCRSLEPVHHQEKKQPASGAYLTWPRFRRLSRFVRFDRKRESKPAQPVGSVSRIVVRR
jgi:hypothetical protein